MGNTNSTSVIKNTTEMITNQVVNMVSNQDVTSLQTQGITVKDAKSDVVISGNTFSQNAYIDFSSVMNAITQQEAQQDIMIQLQNEAKSMNKDLNLFQFADANAVVNNYVNATVNLTTNIVQNCAAASTQSQKISVETAGGKVSITNNTFEQLNKMFSQCLYSATSDQKSMQKMQELIDNKASAVNEGVSIWAIVILAIVALLFMCAPIFIGVWALEHTIMVIIKVILQLIFVLLFFAGVILITMYYVMKENVIRLTPNQATIEQLKDQCQAIPTTKDPIKSYNNAEDAGNQCLEQKYKGFDFVTIGENSSPLTTFYSSMTSQCQNSVNSSELENPYIKIKEPVVLNQLPDPKSRTYKDLVLNCDDGVMYMCLKNSDNVQVWSAVQDSKGKTVLWVPEKYDTGNVAFIYGNNKLPEGSLEKGKFFIQIPYITKDVSTPWRVYCTDNNCIVKGWGYEISPPPYFSYTGDVKYQTVSGFNVKEKKYSVFIMVLGCIFLPIGIIGTILQFKNTKKKNPIQMQKK